MQRARPLIPCDPDSHVGLGGLTTLSRVRRGELGHVDTVLYAMLTLPLNSEDIPSPFTSSVFLVLPVVALVAVIPRYLFEVQPAGAEPRH